MLTIRSLLSTVFSQRLLILSASFLRCSTCFALINLRFRRSLSFSSLVSSSGIGNVVWVWNEKKKVVTTKFTRTCDGSGSIYGKLNGVVYKQQMKIT